MADTCKRPPSTTEPELLNGAVCLVFLVHKQPKIKFAQNVEQENLSSLANLYIEFGWFCCSLSVAFATCIWLEQQAWKSNYPSWENSYFLPRSATYLKAFRLENSVSFSFSGNISIFGHGCAELQILKYGVGGHKKLFLTQFDHQIGISKYFPRAVQELSELFSYLLSSVVAHNHASPSRRCI